MKKQTKQQHTKHLTRADVGERISTLPLANQYTLWLSVRGSSSLACLRRTIFSPSCRTTVVQSAAVKWLSKEGVRARDELRSTRNCDGLLVVLLRVPESHCSALTKPRC